MNITVDQASMRKITETIQQLGFDVRKQVSIALNKTAGKAKVQGARQLRKTVPVKVATSKKAFAIYVSKPEKPVATVILKYKFPVALKHFGARQVATGVLLSKAKSQKLTLGASAFIVNRYDGHVYKRKGKARGPIQRMYGPAGELYESAGVTKATVDAANAELPKQMQERIRFLVTKAQGKLRGNQK